MVKECAFCGVDFKPVQVSEKIPKMIYCSPKCRSSNNTLNSLIKKRGANKNAR